MNLAVPELAEVRVVVLLTFDTQGDVDAADPATRRVRGIGRTGRSTTAMQPSGNTTCGVAYSACCESVRFMTMRSLAHLCRASAE